MTAGRVDDFRDPRQGRLPAPSSRHPRRRSSPRSSRVDGPAIAFAALDTRRTTDLAARSQRCLDFTGCRHTARLQHQSARSKLGVSIAFGSIGSSCMWTSFLLQLAPSYSRARWAPSSRTPDRRAHGALRNALGETKLIAEALTRAAATRSARFPVSRFGVEWRAKTGDGRRRFGAGRWQASSAPSPPARRDLRPATAVAAGRLNECQLPSPAMTLHALRDLVSVRH